MTKFLFKHAAIMPALLLAVPALATPETTTSPTGGNLPSGVTQVGGIVVDMKGTNGTRVVSQLAASQLYRGYADSSENPVAGVAEGNPLLFGTQTGFNAGILGALGGGLSSLSVRISLWDGDTAPGNFDFNHNTFFVNGTSLGDWSGVTTYETSSDGLTLLSTGTGFGNEILSTGFFSTSDAGILSAIFGSMSSTNALAFTLFDTDPYDNFFDFTRGVDGGLINVGQGPVVTPSVPEPATWAMLIFGMFIVAGSLRRRPAQRVNLTYA